MVGPNRSLHLLGATGASRSVMEGGREWLVIPTVALMEGVIFPVNAGSPEFVSAEVLEKAAASWNQKPITLGHPVKNGTQCSANDEAILASHGIGEVRNARYENKKLLCDSWVDTARAEKLHPKMLAQLRADQGVEVSVGAMVMTEARESAFNGKPYKAAWLETKGDHLAFLTGRGACSREMGCGTHRAAMHLVTAEGFELQERRPMPKTLKDLKSRILALFDTPAQAASEEAAELIGYQTLRELLDQLGDSWDAASDQVDELIAAEADPGADEEAETEVERARLEAFRTLCTAMYGHLNALTSATMPKPDGSVSSGTRYMEGMRVAVGRVISAKNMKTVQAAHDSSHDMHTHTTALGAECNGMRLLKAGYEDCTACKGTGNKDGNPCESCDGAGEMKTLKAACGCDNTEAEMTKTERIAALLKHEHNPIKDLKALEANTDEGLRLLEVHCENAATLKAAADKLAADKATSDAALKAAEAANKTVEERLTAAEASLKASGAQKTEEEFLKTAPESIRTLVAEKKATDAARKATLVTTLKTAQSVYDEARLNAMELTQLEEIAALTGAAKPADYSGRGLAVAPGTGTESYVAPNPYEAGVKALQERDKASVN